METLPEFTPREKVALKEAFIDLAKNDVSFRNMLKQIAAKARFERINGGVRS